MCGNTYDRRRILWHARQTRSQQPATAAAAAATGADTGAGAAGAAGAAAITTAAECYWDM